MTGIGLGGRSRTIARRHISAMHILMIEKRVLGEEYFARAKMAKNGRVVRDQTIDFKAACRALKWSI